jgi:hypothetical protein
MKRAIVVLLLLSANALVSSNTSRTLWRDPAETSPETPAAGTDDAELHETDASVALRRGRCVPPVLLTQNTPAFTAAELIQQN